MTLADIAQACGGTLYGIEQEEPNLSTNREATCVVIDSRKLEPGGIFIATRGEKVDGHSFISQVAGEGALGVICEEKPEPMTIPCILVKDSFQALKDVAAYYRNQLSIPVVGITGSVGKTSTKEFISAVLSVKFTVLKTQGNFNNEVGLPLTVLSVRPEHQVAVLEMGISDFGEMHRLSKIARPDICVITNIGQCHLENLGSRQGILKAKTEIFDYMNPEGYVFVNGDDDLLSQLSCQGAHQPVCYGLDPVNDYFASQIESKGLFGTNAVIHENQVVYPVEINVPGKHMVYNALAAAGVGRILGLSTQEICTGIANARTIAGRSNVISLPPYTIIDDCYNANPASMKAALDLLSMALGRRVAILGDMFELGADEEELHRQIGAYVTEKEIDVLLCVGKLSRNIVEQTLSDQTRNKPAAYHFETCDEMLKQLPEILMSDDTILIKASHGMHFEEIVKTFY